MIVSEKLEARCAVWRTSMAFFLILLLLILIFDKAKLHLAINSVHAPSAFAVFISLALFSNKRLWQLLFTFLAMLVAFSRVYLSQHFVMDIWAGALIGCICVAFAWKILKTRENSWLDKSIIHLCK